MRKYSRTYFYLHKISFLRSKQTRAYLQLIVAGECLMTRWTLQTSLKPLARILTFPASILAICDRKLAGKHKLTINEFRMIKKKFNKQANIPIIPDSKAIKLFLTGDYVKKVNKTIDKLELKIVGDKPTENQMDFFIKTRSILDECNLGLSNGLKKSIEYSDLLIKFTEQIPKIDDSTPDWISILLIIPSGLNSMYLYWSYLKPEYQKQLYPNIPLILVEFASQRDSAIDQIINYAKKSIEEM
jgi:hypothetical protein